MSNFAVVILAHADPVQVRRLITALSDVPVFLHCDAKTRPDVRGRMIDGLPSRVKLCRPHSASLASWSLVEAELAALRQALSHTSAQHIVVASGADYPLVSMNELARVLNESAGFSLFSNTPLPFAGWGTPRNPDGGLWRLEHRFLTVHDNVVYIRDIPLRWPTKRKIPAGLELRASSQWKIYARHHVELLLRIRDEQPDLIRFWRTTLIPEESFAASVLGSYALAGSDRLLPSNSNAWYIHWPDGNSLHPSWLGSASFPELARASASARPSSQVVAPPADVNCAGQALFARKFSTRVDTDILDRIDAELRV